MTVPDDQPIRIGTRSSQLALWQANYISDLLHEAAPSRQVEIIHISTTGDQDQQQPLHQLGDFGVFTREVQRVVLDSRVDIAVHSLKDLPTEQVAGLTLAAIPQRGPYYDVLVWPESATEIGGIEKLPIGARIGTGSLRRRAQILHQRSDLQLLEIRGNVETRLQKLNSGDFDAIILAEAGLHRLKLENDKQVSLGPPEMLPAVGQGAIGIECRSDDEELIQILSALTDEVTFHSATAERALLADLRAGCHAPLGVYCQHSDGKLTLQAVVLSADGQKKITASAELPLLQSAELGVQVSAALKQQGAEKLIESSRFTDE